MICDIYIENELVVTCYNSGNEQKYLEKYKEKYPDKIIYCVYRFIYD